MNWSSRTGYNRFLSNILPWPVWEQIKLKFRQIKNVGTFPPKNQNSGLFQQSLNRWAHTGDFKGWEQILSLIARKRGKKLQEKRRKEKIRKRQSHNPASIDTSQFMGVDFEDSVFIPENAPEELNDETENGNVQQIGMHWILGREVHKTLHSEIYKSGNGRCYSFLRSGKRYRRHGR